MRTILKVIAFAFGVLCLSAAPAAAQCPVWATNCNINVNNNGGGNGNQPHMSHNYQQPFMPPQNHYHRGPDRNDLQAAAMAGAATAVILDRVLPRNNGYDVRMNQQNCCGQQGGRHYQGGHSQHQVMQQQQTVTTVSHAVTICGETPAGFNCELSQGDTRYCGQLAANLGCATLVNASNRQPVRRSQVVRLY